MEDKIVINAHARDCFDIGVFKDDKIIYEHSGYLPKFLYNESEDDLYLEIDIDTGKILNWNPNKIKRALNGNLKDVCELNPLMLKEKLKSKDWNVDDINESLAALYYYNNGYDVELLLDYAIEKNMKLKCINGKGVFDPNIEIYNIKKKVSFEEFLNNWSVFRVYQSDRYEIKQKITEKFMNLMD